MKTVQKNSIMYDRTHDLFDIVKQEINNGHIGNSVIIPNICNIKSEHFSRGFATQLSEVFPAALKAYQILSNNERKLGYCQILEVYASKNKEYNHKVYVANMMCQTGFNSKTTLTRNINYAAMASCLTKIHHFINNREAINDTACNIRTHKYLIGYTGADSRFVSYLLEDIFTTYPNIIIHTK
jgi:ribosome-associated toxin RatA of RatAB toxin-antitoxin module